MTQPQQRLRVTFAKGEFLRWISHLDLVRLWERVLRRAGIPVAYTRGYNPQMRIQFAAALPTGSFGRAELFDVWLEKPMSPETFAALIRPQLPSGVELIDVREVDLREPSLQSQVRAAEWRVAVEATEVPEAELRRRVDEVLAAKELIRTRRRRQREAARAYDLRPLIESLRFERKDEEGWVALHMRLRAEPGATGRPDEVLHALGLSGRPSKMERLALYLASPAETSDR